MFSKMRFPVTLNHVELDDYLARGWFRMRQSIFTTNFLHFNNHFFSVIWLRIALDDFTPCKKHRGLLKTNARFRTEIKKARLTPDHETLYQLYRQSISFEVSATLNDLLLGIDALNRYDTYVANVYDGNILIAAGFFDLGKTSAAGISCIYHPAYKKFSLGKYLIFLKIDFCKQQDLKYFYPGYFVPGYNAFDYKVEIGKETLEWFQISTREWLPFQCFTPARNPLLCMVEKLSLLEEQLKLNGIIGTIVYYKFFDAGLDPGFCENSLFDFPVFLYCFSGRDHYNMVVFDVRDNKYHVLQCSSIIQLDYYPNMDNIFSSDLLKIDRNILTTPVANEVADVLPAYI